MADFDDDLLALAGDESEGEEQEELRSDPGLSRSRSPTPARSPSPQNSPPRPSTEDKTSKAPSRRAATSKGMAAKGTAKRRKADESEEEGEASSAPSSPQSLGSGAMDESDSDTSPGDGDDAADDDDNLYPLEGKFRDAKDRAEIMAMTQLEREQILAEREEEQAGRQRDLQLRSMLESKDREAEKVQRKRKAGAADLDDAQRKTSRPKTKRDEALETYTRQREQAREDTRRRDRNRDTRRSRTRSRSRSPADADGESEDEYRRSDVREPEPELSAELQDLQRIRVGRENFGKVCFYPTFEKTMIGCYSRVCIGQNPSGQNTYRITEIKGITTGKPYLMEAHPSFYTDQYVLLASGKSTKEWPFTHCSESPFTEDEFRRWKVQLSHDGLPVPSKSDCRKQCEKIHALIAHRFTEQELNQKLDKQRKYVHLLEASRANHVKKSTGNDLQEKLRLRNEINRKQNAEDVRKALVAEKNRQRAAARAKAAAAAAEAAKKDSLAVPKNDIDGLFSEGSDISRAATPVQKPLNRPEKKGGIPTFTKMSMDDDIIGDMDLGIDIEI